MNQKGANTIFTGIMILVLSVFVMIIVIGLVTPYFNNLNDGIKFKNNKETILSLNEQLLNLKDKETGSIIEININPVSNLEIDHINNKIIITQEINNPQNNFKEQIYNNLTITKENNAFLFVLDLNGIVTLDKSIILSQSRQKLKFEVGEITFGVPYVILNKTSGIISRVIINPQNSVFSAKQIITALATPFDSNIYYTIDGTEPDQNSTLYTGPITITDTTTIKFKAYKDNFDPSITVTGIYTKINGLLFFNKYNEENPLFDLSGNNNRVINNNVLFGINGASFNGNTNKYLFIENDYNDSNPSLNLGINNFTIDTFVSGNYKGRIFSKYSYLGGMDLSINDEGIVDFTISGYDDIRNPAMMAVDEEFVYIADYYNHRVQKRRKDNWELVLMSGGPRATSAIDGYNYPYGVAVDETFVYITDSSNNRMVKRYKNTFEYHSMISGGSGTGENQVRGPTGIAVDENYLYISDAYYHRIKKYDKNTYDLIATLGGISYGSEDTQFYTPRGVAVDDQYMYVTEATYHRVKKYDKNTFKFITKFGGTAASSAIDKFNTPQQITVDENYLYIADYGNHRIQILDKDLNNYAVIASAGLQLAEEYTFYPFGITTDENYIYVTEHLNHRVKKINKSDYSVVSVFSGIAPGEEDMVLPFEIVHDDEHIYYSDPGLYRVVKRRISDMKVVGIIGGPISGSTTTMFVGPYGLAVDDTKLYVADYSNNAIKIYNKETLEYIWACTRNTDTNPKLYYATGVAIDGNYMYVTTNYSSSNQWLLKYLITDNTCTLENSIGGTRGSGIDQFYNPYGIALDENYVYVADATYSRIKKHSKEDLNYVSQLGITDYPNYTVNLLYSPYNVLIDNNYLYVSISPYQTIRKYTTDFNYVSSIGITSGYTNDAFISPRGMTIIDGYIYILDNILGRITKRSLLEFDSNIKVTNEGNDFNYFYGIFSVDADNEYYYIVNYLINRVEKRRKDDLSLVNYFGGPIAFGVTTATSRKYELYTPNDVILDGNFLYISDRTNHRVLRINKDTFIYDTQFGTGSATTSTTTTTRLSSPRQVAFNDSNIYIADTGYNRIVVLNKADMSYITSYGTTGITNDTFTELVGIAVDENYIYTSESTNHRIKKLNISDFSYVTHLGGTAYGNTETTFRTPYYISLDENYIYVGDSANNRIKKHLKEDLSFVTAIGSSGIGANNFITPYGVRYKDENTLLVADYTNHRFHIRNSSDLNSVAIIDLSTFTNDALYNPYSVTSDENYIYISDTGNHRILKKDKNTFETVASIGGPIAGSGNDQFSTPYGIAVDDNFVYVADYSNNRIKRHNKSDLSWSYTYTPGTGVIYNPVGVAVDGNFLYVTTIYSTTRDWVTKINIFSTPWTVNSFLRNSTGTEDDQFNDPRGIAIDDNYIYIADTGNHRIHKRNKNDLSLVQLYGIGVPYGVSQSGTTGTNAFSSPYDVSVKNERLYIADYANHRIKVYDTNFNFLYRYGIIGWGKDMFYYPTGISVDDTYAYIADYANHRIVKRSLESLESLKNLQKNNSIGVLGFNSNTLSSTRRITTDSQIVIKRTGNEFCIYINGEKDNCADFSNQPTYLTFPEINTRYGSSATTTTHYLSENQNYYPYAIGNFGLVTPGNGTIKYFRIYDSNLSDQEILGLYENYK